MAKLAHKLNSDIKCDGETHLCVWVQTDTWPVMCRWQWNCFWSCEALLRITVTWSEVKHRKGGRGVVAIVSVQSHSDPEVIVPELLNGLPYLCVIGCQLNVELCPIWNHSSTDLQLNTGNDVLCWIFSGTLWYLLPYKVITTSRTQMFKFISPIIVFRVPNDVAGEALVRCRWRKAELYSCRQMAAFIRHRNPRRKEEWQVGSHLQTWNAGIQLLEGQEKRLKFSNSEFWPWHLPYYCNSLQKCWQ